VDRQSNALPDESLSCAKEAGAAPAAAIAAPAVIIVVIRVPVSRVPSVAGSGSGLEFLLLGPLEVRVEGRPVHLGAAKERALLAVLLLEANKLVSIDRLIDDLWGEQAPASASHSVQVYVSQLRKAFARHGVVGAEVLTTHTSGYLLRVPAEQFDLSRFQRLSEEAARVRANGDLGQAAQLLQEALSLWRGGALSDLLREPFARRAATRLEEIRLAVVERRIEVELLIGRHAELVGEIEQLVAEYPLREGLHGQLMLALYRSGRQAEALEVYRDLRRRLSEELGLDPNRALQQLEQSILRHDVGLEPPTADSIAPHQPSVAQRSILVIEHEDAGFERLLMFAEPLAKLPERELILTAFVREAGRLGRIAVRMHERRGELLDRGLLVRSAAFTSVTPGADAVRLVSEQNVDLLLISGSSEFLLGTAASEVELVLAQAGCQVCIVFASLPQLTSGGCVIVPFGGADDDWAAVELAAWLARGQGVNLKLLGTAGNSTGSRRDASRLLASASLAVQRATGIPAEPCLIPGGMEPLLAAVEGAFALVVGLSRRWRQEGIGPMRLALAQQAAAPTLFVRSSLRPGGLAPSESLTRYTWSLASGYE
jgi:DNA-binding SARP family transcriptional activator